MPTVVAKIRRTAYTLGTQVPTTGNKYPRGGETVPELISISEAAERLGVKPWEVVRLIEAGQLKRVVLVVADSLNDYQESA
jgi:hypothetical protein